MLATGYRTIIDTALPRPLYSAPNQQGLAQMIPNKAEDTFEKLGEIRHDSILCRTTCGTGLPATWCPCVRTPRLPGAEANVHATEAQKHRDMCSGGTEHLDGGAVPLG